MRAGRAAPRPAPSPPPTTPEVAAWPGSGSSEMRDYNAIVRRVEALDADHAHRRVLFEAEGYPVFALTLARDSARPTALLLAGTHGDEPAGVEAALTMLERHLPTWLHAFRFEAVPCLNPWGYVHDRRHNAQEADVNWSYDRTDLPEVEGLRRLLGGDRFEFVLDLHEDWESPGYYLWEQCRGRPPVGNDITGRAARVCPINTSPVIEGFPARNGLILPDLHEEEARRGRNIPLMLFKKNTDHCLTCESPTALDMESRVQAHIAAFGAVAEAHLTAPTVPSSASRGPA